MVAQVVFGDTINFYLPALVRRYPNLERFYHQGRLYMDIRVLHHPLPVQILYGHPDSEFGLFIGERKNYIITTRLNLCAVTPAFTYASPLEEIAGKEVAQVRKEFGGDRKVALYIENEFKGMI